MERQRLRVATRCSVEYYQLFKISLAVRGQINNSNHHHYHYHHHQRDVLRWEVPQRKFCIFIVTKRTSGRTETEHMA